MRFMVMFMASKEFEANPPAASPEAFVAMQQYNEDLAKRGILLAAEGLSPSSKASRVKFSRGKSTVIDGPFAEAKEVVAGFTILNVNSKEEAIEIAKRAPNAFPELETVVEIRKLMDADDFGEGFTPNEEIAKVKY